MSLDPKQWLMWISEIQALSQSGLTYTSNEFDQERYTKLTLLSAEMAAAASHNDFDFIHPLFSIVPKTYATPRVDIRSFVLQHDKVLLVRERADGLWTLPGGFADVNESPSEAVIRETLEESGYLVEPCSLLAVWDKLKHAHPLEWPHIYKCIFHCNLISGEPKINLEISDIDFFSMSDIPALSTPRITLDQLHTLYELVANPQLTVFD